MLTVCVYFSVDLLGLPSLFNKNDLRFFSSEIGLNGLCFFMLHILEKILLEKS